MILSLVLVSHQEAAETIEDEAFLTVDEIHQRDGWLEIKPLAYRYSAKQSVQCFQGYNSGIWTKKYRN